MTDAKDSDVELLASDVTHVDASTADAVFGDTVPAHDADEPSMKDVRLQYTARVLCVIAVLVTVAVVGIALLVPGAMQAFSAEEEITQSFAFHLCAVTEPPPLPGALVEYVVYDAPDCPAVLRKGDAAPQSVNIPAANLVVDKPYEPVLLLSDNVTGVISLTVRIGEFKRNIVHDIALSVLHSQPFFIAGGAPLAVQTAPNTTREELSGSFDAMCTAEQAAAAGGCQYHPLRSLTRYSIAAAQAVDPTSRSAYPADGLHLVLEKCELSDRLYRAAAGTTARQNTSSTDSTDCTFVGIKPDVLVRWQSVGASSPQNTGLILVIFGVLLVDLTPATLFFFIHRRKEAQLRQQERQRRELASLLSEEERKVLLLET